MPNFIPRFSPLLKFSLFLSLRRDGKERTLGTRLSGATLAAVKLLLSFRNLSIFCNLHFIQVPYCLLCGSFLDYIHETNFWMSSGGTRSVIHYDADHNLHCLVSGRKDFIMIERKYAEDLYFFEMVW